MSVPASNFTSVANAPHAYGWVVDMVLELRRLGVPLTPELQRLLPLGPLVAWAIDLKSDPTWQDIANRWGVHRATAFRWRPALLRARREFHAS